jgi:uncharacterized membrane protein
MDRFFTETNRLEAFSDGVLAVIITIMVLELHAPAMTHLSALGSVLPNIGVYAVSFVFIGIYWNNHHHMLRASRGIDGRAMWANLNLLFWLSLVPFSTAWLGANPTAVGPTIFYSLILLLAGFAYAILETTLVKVNGRDTAFGKAIGFDRKGWLSIVLYILAMSLALVSTIISDALIIAVAIMWIVPDRRFEPLIAVHNETEEHEENHG